jgi:hypothetical protein
MSEQTATQTPLVIDPEVEVSIVIRDLVGHMGDVDEIPGGFKIKIHHGGSFQWFELFKALLYRDFKVNVTRHKAELFIEAVK